MCFFLFYKVTGLQKKKKQAGKNKRKYWYFIQNTSFRRNLFFVLNCKLVTVDTKLTILKKQL